MFDTEPRPRAQEVELSAGEAALSRKRTLSGLFAKAFHLDMQGIGKLFEHGAEFGGLGGNDRFGTQFTYAVLQAARPEMPGDKTTEQAAGGCVRVVHESEQCKQVSVSDGVTESNQVESVESDTGDSGAVPSSRFCWG